MKFTDLRFVPLGGVGEIGVNAYLYGQDGRWLMVDLGIGFRRRPAARRRHRPARPALHRGAAGLPRRPDPDPRPRGPSGRRALSVAAPGLPDLVHARSPPPSCARSSSETDFARDVPIRIVEPGQPFQVGGIELPLHPRHPLDPGRQRAGAGHRLRPAAAHRRLEARPGAAGRRPDRRRLAGGPRQGGRARDPVRQHQRALARAPRAPRPRCATA